MPTRPHRFMGLSPRVRGNRRVEGQPGYPSRSIPACAGEPATFAIPRPHRAVYPRVCGGTVQTLEFLPESDGLSPRVRGNQLPPLPGPARLGSIPACAGEPYAAIRDFTICGVYPRVCGGTSQAMRRADGVGGLSPRVRGNHDLRRRLVRRGRSIPACAGEPPGSQSWLRPAGVYPRVCGGTYLPDHAVERVLGLSPRVRGNRRCRLRSRIRRRSIPACAGEPYAAIRDFTICGVYPRVCGGTSQAMRRADGVGGLSPRVRGNHDLRRRLVRRGRSIPACAGEPLFSTLRPNDWGVYPRVCGGTYRSPSRTLWEYGLSPRVRGNLSRKENGSCIVRSIPACAGEPSGCDWPLPPAGVYPRVCGGTPRGLPPPRPKRGLSPRVRGNQRANDHIHQRGGSIPACAGEPDALLKSAAAQWVYPRVCGGTFVPATLRGCRRGLSPRVRGNLRAGPRRTSASGSIPACAGEPCPAWAWASPCWVYPRVCGGTDYDDWLAAVSAGLSPRVRGNRSHRLYLRALGGSIPACAGEPGSLPNGRLQNKVYPHVCGGTRHCVDAPAYHPGLSPRVRGNLALSTRREGRVGSIPACAGEPAGRTTGGRWCWVYPRVCGGTSGLCGGGGRRQGLSPRVRGNRGGGTGGPGGVRSIPACAGEPSIGGRRPPVRPVYPRVCGGTRRRGWRGCGGWGLSPRVRGNRNRGGAGGVGGGSIPACAGEPSCYRLPSIISAVYPRVCGGTRSACPWVCP